MIYKYKRFLNSLLAFHLSSNNPHLSSPASLLFSILPIIHRSFPPTIHIYPVPHPYSSPSFLLFIAPFLSSSTLASLLSCITPVPHPSFPASLQSTCPEFACPASFLFYFLLSRIHPFQHASSSTESLLSCIPL